MEFYIRAMGLSDIPAVYEIELAGHKVPWTERILRDCVLVGYDCRVLQLVGKESSSIIGYAISRPVANVCHILNFCISPSYQRKGMGKQLMLNILHEPIRHAMSEVTLEVRPSNLAAIQLYKSLGFEKRGIREGYYKDNFGTEDAWIFTKTMVIRPPDLKKGS